MIWFKSSKRRLIKNLQEEQIFEIIANEIYNNEIRPGLWAKAYAETGGDDKRTQARYIKLRAAQIRLGIDESERILENIRTETKEAIQPAEKTEPTPPEAEMRLARSSWGLICEFCLGDDIEPPDLNSGQQAYCYKCKRYLKWSETAGKQEVEYRSACPVCGNDSLRIQDFLMRWCPDCGEKNIRC